jgi:ABC-2 type transport system ATP-binding protein
MNQPILEIRDLKRNFGKKIALDGVSLTIPTGGVFGLIGGNGAGKTTLLKHTLGLLSAQSGSVRIFGLDPVADPVGALSRIGYLSENRDLPDWMRIHQLISYTRAFYPNWDPDYAETLRRDFELDPNAFVKTLSRGQRARAGLLVALAHRPDLLILDEPSSGLDPVVRRDILGAIIRTIADEGRTVLFSSHLLDEVERVADRIAILHQGRIQLCAPMEQVRSGHKRVQLRLSSSVSHFPPGGIWIGGEGSGHDWSMVAEAEIDAIREAVSLLKAEILSIEPMSLDDIFVARTAGKALVAGGKS